MRLISILYFLLLSYMIAALLFWGHSLDRQNGIIFQNELDALHSRIDSVAQPEAYIAKFKAIKEDENARKRQYMGEGTTFLIIILMGAGVVYSSIRSNDKLARQQTNFILSITHELKSPIAAVKLNLQTLSKRKLDETVQKTLLDRSITEANRLDDLCNNLLLASQMEDRHFNPANERINFSAILEECCRVFESRLKNLFVTDIEADCFTYGDPLLWRLAINNLLENAAKYGGPGGTISTKLSRQDEELVFSVADEGEGIPDEEKGKIFNKFYRVGNENARKSKGTGLGLYLTARIIRQFKGAIVVRDNIPKGSVFEVTFPAG
jgi:signal transduction histidine kinase